MMCSVGFDPAGASHAAPQYSALSGWPHIDGADRRQSSRFHRIEREFGNRFSLSASAWNSRRDHRAPSPRAQTEGDHLHTAPDA
jgi:hypothetical protein